MRDSDNDNLDFLHALADRFKDTPIHVWITDAVDGYRELAEGLDKVLEVCERGTSAMEPVLDVISPLLQDPWRQGGQFIESDGQA